LSIRNYSFEDFVQEANRATSPAALFETLLRAVSKHGLDRAVFSLLTTHSEIEQQAAFGLVHNYPADWFKHYNENDYHYIDPVTLYGATAIDAFHWSDLPQKFILSKSQKLVLDLGAEAGLHNGVATPLRGASNELAGVALATTEQKDAFDGNIDLIAAYCNHFYLAYRRLLKVDGDESTPRPYLTKRERDVLQWMALGKTNSEIGDILLITEHTVDSHIRKIFLKLETNNRLLASIKALNLGIIHL